MSKWAIIFWVGALVVGTSGGLLWVHAVSGPSPAPVMDLHVRTATSSPVAGDGGFIAVNGVTSIVGGPSPATVDLTFTVGEGEPYSVRFHTILKRDGTWSFNLPVVPVGGPGVGTVEVTVRAGGKTATDTVGLAVTGGEFGCSMAAVPTTWAFENDNRTQGRHVVTVTVSATPQPPYPWWGDPTYTYQWRSVIHPHTGKAMVLVSGGGANDASATYAAPQAPAASKQPYVVTCDLVADYGMYGKDEAMAAVAVPVRLLGDANGDGAVTVTDFSTWKAQNGQTGQGLSGDFNGDGSVTVTDFSIWKANNGQSAPD